MEEQWEPDVEPPGVRATLLGRIPGMWDDLTREAPHDAGRHIGLPFPFVIPSGGTFEGDQFYWDTYFTVVGLLLSGKVALARGMVDNLLYLFERFGIVPSRNRFSNTGISQPPFLTSMAREVFARTADREWLGRVFATAEREYREYWTSSDGVVAHLSLEGLSRYADHYLVHATAEHESGWDMTSRFADRALDFIPVDLNALLYRYETDFAWYAGVKGDHPAVSRWERAAADRASSMRRLLYDARRGYWFDFDVSRQRRSRFWSLAGFYPVWAGIATPSEAERSRQALAAFECRGGLVNTQAAGLRAPQRQWDYPNGWPNQQMLIARALRDHGFHEDARRVAGRFVDTIERVYAATGLVWEKYDVVSAAVGKDGHYRTQPGFAWTLAAYLALLDVMADGSEGRQV